MWIDNNLDMLIGDKICVWLHLHNQVTIHLELNFKLHVPFACLWYSFGLYCGTSLKCYYLIVCFILIHHQEIIQVKFAMYFMFLMSRLTSRTFMPFSQGMEPYLFLFSVVWTLLTASGENNVHPNGSILDSNLVLESSSLGFPQFTKASNFSPVSLIHDLICFSQIFISSICNRNLILHFFQFDHCETGGLPPHSQ